MRSLRRRLTFTHTMVALLAVVLMALLASGLIARAYAQFAQSQARVIGQALARPLADYYLRNRSWNNLGERLPLRFSSGNLPIARRVLVADERWQVVFDSSGSIEGDAVPRLLRPQATPIRVREGVVGYVVVPVGGDDLNDEERVFVRSVMLIVVVGGLAAGGVALLVALLVARRLTHPLRSLTVAARRLAAGERHQPIPPPNDTELAELAGAFNSMAAELARQESLRRQMVADIAHELRTPLSVLRLQVESLEDGVEQPSPQVYTSLSHEVDMLARLVDDLRLISLADSGQLALAIEPVDVQAALGRAAAGAAPRARQQGIDLRVEHNGVLPPVGADAQRLAQVLGNLIENALRYTPAGGQVTLRARQERGQDQIAIEVADSGPGIAPEDLPHIFDRFFRTDRARARETGGSGLGLAIVQRLVAAQGGHIAVQSQPGQGTTFQVLLPAIVNAPRR